MPPYAIVGDVPAKVIKFRFEPEMIEGHMKIDYSKLNKQMIEKHIDDLYAELKDRRQLEWRPKSKRICCRIEKNVVINLMYHAGIGTRCVDKCIEFRDYGAFIERRENVFC